MGSGNFEYDASPAMPASPDGMVALVLVTPEGQESIPDFSSWLSSVRSSLGERALICCEIRNDRPDRTRSHLQNVFRDEEYRGEVVTHVPGDPALPGSPLVSTTRQIVIYSNSRDHVIPRPGKWDTFTVPSRPELNAHKKSNEGSHTISVDKELDYSPILGGTWTRERILAATSLYKRWKAEESATLTFDEFHRREVERAGHHVDGLRKHGPSIQLYFPPEFNQALENDWADVGADDRTTTTMSGEILERMLEWFSRPGEVVWVVADDKSAEVVAADIEANSRVARTGVTIGNRSLETTHAG